MQRELVLAFAFLAVSERVCSCSHVSKLILNSWFVFLMLKL